MLQIFTQMNIEKKKIDKKKILLIINLEILNIGRLGKEQILEAFKAIKSFYDPICKGVENTKTENFIFKYQGIDLCFSDKTNLKKEILFVKPQITFDILIEDFSDFFIKMDFPNFILYIKLKNIIQKVLEFTVR